MEHHTDQLIALLEERLERLKALAREIEAAQKACIALDLEALRNHDAQKERLCAEIRRLDGEIAGVAGEGLEAEAARRLEGLMGASEAAREEVAELNRVYAAFLARSRNTLKVMANVISHCLGVYPKLQRTASTAAPFERSI